MNSSLILGLLGNKIHQSRNHSFYLGDKSGNTIYLNMFVSLFLIQIAVSPDITVRVPRCPVDKTWGECACYSCLVAVSCITGHTVRNPLLLCPLVLAQDGGTRSRPKCLHRDFWATVLSFTTEMHQSVGNGMCEFCNISKLTITLVDANDLTSCESQC